LTRAVPRVVFTRGGLDESAHRVHVAVANEDGELVASAGNADVVTFPRSSSKPFQALPLAQAIPDLPADELAVACASHAGTDEHLRVVRKLLDRAGIGVDALQCGVHMPFDAGAAAALVRAGHAPTPLHHNCSGKHAGMLLTCVTRGLDTTEYTSAEHPLQREVRSLHARLGGLPGAESVRVGRDGCSVPAMAVSLRAGASLFARLAAPSGAYAEALERVFQAMRSHPLLVAGVGRLDTELMPRVPGCVSKMGAEGYFGLALRETPRGPLGVAIKVEDGAERARAPVTLAVLRALGVPYDADLDSVYPAVLRNFAGLEVGSVRADVALRFHGM